MTNKRTEIGLTPGTQALCYTALAAYVGMKITSAAVSYHSNKKSMKLGKQILDEAMTLVKRMYDDLKEGF